MIRRGSRGTGMSGIRAAPGSSAEPTDAVRWRGSLRTRIALWSGVVNVALVLLITGVTAWFARDLILDDAKQDTRASAQEAGQRLDNVMRMVTITTSGLSDLAANSPLDADQLTATLRAMIKATPGAAGGLLVLEPRTSGDKPFARYIAVDGNDRDFIADRYDYRAQAWYQRTLSSPGGWWSEPYLNQTAGQVWMATYNVPLQPPSRGMASLDMQLDDLVAPVESLAHLPGVRVTLVAPEGTVAFSTIPDIALRDTLQGYITRAGRNDLQWAADAVRQRQAAHLSHLDTQTGQQRFTAVEPVGDSGWALLVGQT